MSTLPDRFALHSRSGTVPGDGSALDVEFDAFEGGAYGLSRLALATDADPRWQLATVSLRLDGRRVLIEEVSVHTLQRLFERRGLRSPVVVGRSETVRLAVRTEDAEGAGFVRASIVGLTDEQLVTARDAGRIRAGREAEPVLLAATVDVPAGATAHPVRLLERGMDLDVVRLVASTADPAGDVALALTLQGPTGDLLQSVCPEQLQVLFGEREATPALRCDASRPPVLLVDNPTADVHRLSVIAEAYRPDRSGSR